jgi:hypothetical protein
VNSGRLLSSVPDDGFCKRLESGNADRGRF